MTELHHGDADDASDVPVVVLISAEWAGPSRPAPTVLRELAARWGPRLRTLHLDDPSEEMLDLLAVDVLPTWLRFARTSGGPEAVASRETGALHVSELQGRDRRGADVVLPGPWRLQRRRTGALPKHLVEAEFGPATTIEP